ncbi:hypothetical protein [Legionella shakespearei]|uniref:VipA n=1 Tax=Legionella shakespearei DSM 23087 TaxID=1122169 RepID=A0A0W0Z2K8_9GAMM|nr:hypothetical protein [Legionella shakespearei]KTD63392.1 VipA [Legionella shakespearei DSM 23087]
MPISKEFLPLFKDFVTNYKIKGTPAFYTWAKEHNHTQISQFFDELLALIDSNQESFHDASIIDHLNVTVLLSANTNRYLLECWIDFLTKYNEATKSYSPISSMDGQTPVHIQVAPEGTKSERMLIDLKKALETTQQAFALSQQANSTEIALLKRQLAEFKEQNARLSTENRLLKDQVRNEQMFRDLHPQISSAQEQLSSFAALIQTLSEVTGKKPEAVPPPVVFVTEHTETSTAPVPVAPVIPVVKTEPEPAPIINNQSTTTAPLPPPPPRIISPPAPAVATTTPVKPTFFPKPAKASTGSLFSELAAVLKEREANAASNTTPTIGEKKSL